MTSAAIEPEPREASSLPLWAGVLGAPAAWAVQLQVSYSFVPWCCSHGHLWVLHLSTLVFFALAAAGGVASFRHWRRAGGGSAEGSGGGPVVRTQFLGLLGVLVSSMFSLLILAQGTASFFISPCWD